MTMIQSDRLRLSSCVISLPIPSAAYREVAEALRRPATLPHVATHLSAAAAATGLHCLVLALANLAAADSLETWEAVG